MAGRIRKYITAVNQWKRRTIRFTDKSTVREFSVNKKKYFVPKTTSSGVAYKIFVNPAKRNSIFVLRLETRDLHSTDGKYFTFKLMERRLNGVEKYSKAYSVAEINRRDGLANFHYTYVKPEYRRMRLGTMLDYERTVAFIDEGIKQISSGIEPTEEARASADGKLYDKPGFDGIRRKKLFTLEELEGQIQVLRAKTG